MIKVLIVEDDPMVREINERFLAKIEGYVLMDSVSGLDRARELMKQSEPDLILLDVFFPQGKGVELLHWIRREGMRSDVIMITADRSVETVEEALRYGAVDYLVKPFKFKRFEETLTQYRARRKNLTESKNFEQDMIDQLVMRDTPGQERDDEDLIDTKGFSQLTYDKVCESIRNFGSESFTAQQIAKKIGVSRITARRYLDYMEKEDKLEIELEYGKVGRPKNRYRSRVRDSE
jgi:response regulator of citrate/malate metabolism